MNYEKLYIKALDRLALVTSEIAEARLEIRRLEIAMAYRDRECQRLKNRLAIAKDPRPMAVPEKVGA